MPGGRGPALGTHPFSPGLTRMLCISADWRHPELGLVLAGSRDRRGGRAEGVSVNHTRQSAVNSTAQVGPGVRR
jgi:hypothetical protein